MEKAALGAAATYTTPRTLLSILRISQALAKLRFSSLVEQVGCSARGWIAGAQNICWTWEPSLFRCRFMKAQVGMARPSKVVKC